MLLEKAINALKNKDFATARDLVAGEKAATYGITHFLIKGLAELSLSDWGAAAATFTAATQRFPDHVAFWLNRGIAEENLGQVAAAIASQEKCLALNPSQGEAYGNLSNLYRKKNRFAEAEAMARKALESGSAKGDALNSLGLALAKQGKFVEADAAYREAQKAAPDDPAILLNRANLAVDQLHFEEAWPLFAAARAMKDDPVFRHDEGLARLLVGDYKRGWDLFESRLEMPAALRLHPPCPRWNGENLSNKKLLIVAEQGFGDVIHFCHYGTFIPDAELVWAVPRNLVRLLSGAVRGKVYDETTALPACDYYIPIMSLPFVLQLHQQEKKPSPHSGERGLGEGRLENAEPHNPRSPLFIPQSPETTPILPSGKHTTKIGLVWAGSPTHQHDHERSIKLELFAQLLNEINADFYASFMGDALNEIGDLPIIRLDTLITDFADTAALLKQLDYLITVDTAVAHLAGALGVKTYLLLAYCPDWRWGISGETTEWYPSLTMIRQKKYGDWKSVIKALLFSLLPCP